MKPVSIPAVIDSRHLKILAAKKEQLKDSIVFISLGDEKFGFYDVAQLRKVAEMIDKIQPDAFYILSAKQLKVNIFNKTDFKNKDIVLTIEHPQDEELDQQQVEEQFKAAFAGVRSIKFIHMYAEETK